MAFPQGHEYVFHTDTSTLIVVPFDHPSPLYSFPTPPERSMSPPPTFYFAKHIAMILQLILGQPRVELQPTPPSYYKLLKRVSFVSFKSPCG